MFGTLALDGAATFGKHPNHWTKPNSSLPIKARGTYFILSSTARRALRTFVEVLDRCSLAHAQNWSGTVLLW